MARSQKHSAPNPGELSNDQTTTGFHRFTDLGCKNVMPIRVKIKGRVYDGMKYTDPRFNNAARRVYFLGDCRPCYLRRPKPHSPSPAIPATGISVLICPRNASVHLRTNSNPFTLSGRISYLRLDIKRIDHYEENKYTRVPIEEVHDV